MNDPICKGKSLLEPSNNDTDQINVDQARTIHFQDEIIMDILSRLPVRSLVRFKCVSKFWYALISDPYFRMMHLKRAKNDKNSQKFLVNLMSSDDMLFSCYSCPLSPVKMGEDVRELDRPLGCSGQYFRIRSSCDGLVVVMGICDLGPTLLLWNPSTNESIELPSVELQGEDFRFGMGYDSSCNDYKILIISNAKDGPALPNLILTLRSGSWRKIDKHPHVICNNVDHMHTLAFVHETFHWIGMSRNYSLVSLSISNEVYGEVALPEQISCVLPDVHNSVGVVVLDEKLCVYTNSRQPTLKLWVLNDNESWSALFTIEDPSIFFVLPKYRFAEGELLFWCCHLPTGGHTFRTPSGPFVYWPQSDIQCGLAFTESLISPRSLIGF